MLFFAIACAAVGPHNGKLAAFLIIGSCGLGLILGIVAISIGPRSGAVLAQSILGIVLSVTLTLLTLLIAHAVQQSRIT